MTIFNIQIRVYNFLECRNSLTEYFLKTIIFLCLVFLNSFWWRDRFGFVRVEIDTLHVGPDGNPGWDPEVVLAYVPNNSSSGLSVVYIESYTE